MPIVVVGGSGRNVGKTSFICGIVASLPELSWIGVKVTSDEHGSAHGLQEEQAPGRATDTARFLAAGARRAFLIAADETEWPSLLEDLRSRIEPSAALVFESNRIVNLVRPDVYLAVRGSEERDSKPSFQSLAHLTHATVMRDGQDGLIPGPQPVFKLADLSRPSPELKRWLRDRLNLSDTRSRFE